jgi:hypothetical protein
MWTSLSSYNIESINRLEDDLKDKTKQLDKLKEDHEAMERISKDQNQALESLGGRNKENSEKMYNLNN